MSITTFIGKILIIASIGFQAFLLFQDKPTITSFNKQLNHAVTHCKCEMLTPDIQILLKEHLRNVVGGLLASSVLVVLFKHWAAKLPTLLGLFALLYIEHHESFKSIPSLDNTLLWHSLGVIGAIIYLLGAECTSGSKQNKDEKIAENIKESENVIDSKGNRKNKRA